MPQSKYLHSLSHAITGLLDPTDRVRPCSQLVRIIFLSSSAMSMLMADALAAAHCKANSLNTKHSEIKKTTKTKQKTTQQNHFFNLTFAIWTSCKPSTFNNAIKHLAALTWQFLASSSTSSSSSSAHHRLAFSKLFQYYL